MTKLSNSQKYTCPLSQKFSSHLCHENAAQREENENKTFLPVTYATFSNYKTPLSQSSPAPDTLVLKGQENKLGNLVMA
jgi:hypothetical protein